MDALKAQLAIEDSKAKIKITKPEILKFISKAIREEPAQMISLLVKKIVLTDDTIDIYYNTTERKRPDGEDSHQAFSFYSEKLNYENNAWWFTMKGGNTTEILVSLFI
jgi:hypothetical protein